MTTKTCCNTSVGVIIRDNLGRVLMFTRPDGKGIAPVAGHIHDEHPNARAAAITETREEVGLTVTHLDPVTSVWRWNRCKRAPGPLGHGHHWTVYDAGTAWSGDLNPSFRETRDAAWYTPAEVEELAVRTARFALQPRPDDAEVWAAAPGLEAVWVQFMVDLRLACIGDHILPAIEGFAVMGVPHAPAAAWPANLHSRLATVGGARVDVLLDRYDGDDPIRWEIRTLCTGTGCLHAETWVGKDDGPLAAVRDEAVGVAQLHASRCRFTVKPPAPR